MNTNLITITKFVDLETSTLKVKIEVSDVMKVFLDKFSVKEETKRMTDYSVDRYLIKNQLHNHRYWSWAFELLFAKELVETKVLNLSLTNESLFHNIVSRMKQIKELYKRCKDLQPVTVQAMGSE